MRTYLLANPFEIISDVGSGINYKRKGLLGFACNWALLKEIDACEASGKFISHFDLRCVKYKEPQITFDGLN